MGVRDNMSKNKHLAKFVKKFQRSVTTYPGKQINFSTNFKNVVKSIPYSECSETIDMSWLL